MVSEAAGWRRWRVRPVFLSSTFRDMHAERDWLREHVFPALTERLVERGYHLEVIDLRVGVETAELGSEEARELLVLKVCLNEIERSRPYMIVLLGDRYGWRPPAERMVRAAQEAGFDTDVADKSVTALEIEFGILGRDPEQIERSFFFFREPLPYASMPREIAASLSDEYSGAQDVRDGFQRLQALKQRIAEDPRLGPHVRRYRVEWDAEKQRVTGLESFGDMVLEVLWQALDEETRAAAEEREPTWEEQERERLEEFIEQCGRGFVGREAITGELLQFAQSPPGHDAWGVCVTGAAGSGKSALFAHLCRELDQRDVVVLSHAAGISPRAGSVGTMLRRWVGELSAVLQQPDPLTEQSSAEDIKRVFAECLSRAAVSRRVVVLVDALNQFEPVPEARHLLWLPELWPQNARFIATAIPGTESEAAGKRRGVALRELEPLQLPEAEGIVRKVYGRYHREPNRAAVQLLLEKRDTAGGLASGNPLWLELALEELNLLDEDDFARAEREYSGGAAEKLQQLMLDKARSLPGGVPALFATLLEHTEEVYGRAWARAFANLIALSRTGWRELDLQKLLPKVAQMLEPQGAEEPWDALRFAALRRGFRGQLVKRGSQEQWDFAHAQMRIAIRERNLRDEEQAQALHTAIADHFEELPREDPLRIAELMYHLIQGDLKERAAKHLVDCSTQAELNASITSLLVQIINAEQASSVTATAPVDSVAWTLSMIEQCIDDTDFTIRLCGDALATLVILMKDWTLLTTRTALLEGILSILKSLPVNHIVDTELIFIKYSYFEQLGDAYAKLHRYLMAEECYQEVSRFGATLSSAVTDDQRGLLALAISNSRLADLAVRRSDYRNAEEYYLTALKHYIQLARLDPHNRGYLNNIGALNERLGDRYRDNGNPSQALKYYEESLRNSELLQNMFPNDLMVLQNLPFAYERVAHILNIQNNLSTALMYAEKSMAAAENVIQIDPDAVESLRSFVYSCWTYSEVLANTGQKAKAVAELKNALEVCRKLEKRVGDEKEYSRMVGKLLGKIGELLT